MSVALRGYSISIRCMKHLCPDCDAWSPTSQWAEYYGDTRACPRCGTLHDIGELYSKLPNSDGEE